MFEQDYIMRQIKQFTHALEIVLFKKKEGKQQEAQNIIENSLTELLEEHHDNFHQLSLEETLCALENSGSFNAELALIVADLLYEQSELADKKESQQCYLQALLLYHKAMKDPGTAFPLQATQKISHIKSELDPSDLGKVKQLLE